MIRDLGAALKTALPASDVQLLELIAEVAEARGLPLYAVGGLPRDLALGRSPADFDLVVEGSAIALARLLAGEFGGAVTGHATFGTAQWKLEPSRLPWAASDRVHETPKRRSRIDLVSARRESYSREGALPEVSGGSIGDDLRRRDFTINSLALRLDGRHYGELLDPLGALGDLDRRVIRTLHQDSFLDDPTRMLRAVRYEQRLGFRIEAGTLRRIPDGVRWLRRVSAHRVRQELEAALLEERAARMIRRMGQLGLLRAIHPALPHDAACLRRLRSNSQAGQAQSDAAPREGGSMSWLLWLLELSPAQVRSVRARLQLSTQLTEELLAAVRLWRGKRVFADAPPSQLTKRLDQFPLRSVRAVERGLSIRRQKRMLRTYLGKWRTQHPITTGRDLVRRGVPAGPMYASILDRLRAGWIDGTITSAAQEQRALEVLLKRARGAHRGRV